jgi:hypothetical protein
VLDFDVQKFTRICAVTKHEFQPAETFFAYLIREGSHTVRRDVCRDAWDGPPEGCIAWWKSSVPDRHSQKMHWAPDDVMLHYFQETEDKPDEQDVRYLLTLLFIRRRLFKLVDTVQEELGEALLVTCSRNESEYTVPVVEVNADRASEIQVLLSQLMVDAGSS